MESGGQRMTQNTTKPAAEPDGSCLYRDALRTARANQWHGRAIFDTGKTGDGFRIYCCGDALGPATIVGNVRDFNDA